MLRRKTKSIFYSLAGPLMWCNGKVYKSIRSPRDGLVKVHLGPGQQRYLNGWINVDANKFTGKCDVWANLDDGIPFRDSSVDAFYSHHVIEHLSDLQGHFNEMYRCLKPGGVFRVGGPNGDMAILKFTEGDKDWFSNYPDNRTSIGGRFENFIFCRQEHLTILTKSYLQELAINSGFEDIKIASPCLTTYYSHVFGSEVLGIEHERTPDAPHTLIVEGRKD